MAPRAFTETFNETPDNLEPPIGNELVTILKRGQRLVRIDNNKLQHLKAELIN